MSERDKVIITTIWAVILKSALQNNHPSFSGADF